jgi:DNA-binding PadR family transcriptional regulator
MQLSDKDINMDDGRSFDADRENALHAGDAQQPSGTHRVKIAFVKRGRSGTTYRVMYRNKILIEKTKDKGQKIYRLTEMGQIALTSEDEHSGLKLHVFTEMGRIARMTRKERVALVQKMLDGMVKEGLVRVDGINEKGQNVYALTEMGLLHGETKH